MKNYVVRIFNTDNLQYYEEYFEFETVNEAEEQISSWKEMDAGDGWDDIYIIYSRGEDGNLVYEETF